MSITCQICKTEFAKIIPWQHLRTHNISSAEYKLSYGNLYSTETLALFQQRVPHNRGVKITDPEKLERQRAAVKSREQRYQAGDLVRKTGYQLNDNTRSKISLGVQKYAAENPDAMKQRTAKAIETKQQSGYDFGSPMRGRTHNEQSLEKIRVASKQSNKVKSDLANENILNLAIKYNYKICNNLNNNIVDLQCQVCDTNFSYTRQYFTPSKFQGSMCPTCYPRKITRSRAEKELFEFVSNLCPDARSNYRSRKYHDNELDIFVPSRNLAIEYNGLYWHSELVQLANDRSPKRDYEKYKAITDQGIQLITIFEDEWHLHQDIVRSRLRHLLGVSSQRIYARQCQIREITSKVAGEFCRDNHIQGSGRTNYRLGLYYKDRLVSVMTFAKDNISRKNNSTWEINRFCSLLDTSIVGAAGRLFKHFVKTQNPDRVISYSDNRWSQGHLYQTLGFDLVNRGTPNYWYIRPNYIGRIHRYTLRKNSADDPTLTEWENRVQQGLNRVWDCGHSLYEWRKTGTRVPVL